MRWRQRAPQAIFERKRYEMVDFHRVFPQNRRLRRAETDVLGCEQALEAPERRPTDRLGRQSRSRELGRFLWGSASGMRSGPEG